MSKRNVSQSSGSPKKSKSSSSNDLDAVGEITKVDINKLMTTSYENIVCVLLKQDGQTEEIIIDMTPRLKETQKILGGDVTFLGQWEEMEVILMINRNQSKDDNRKNQHKLQPPFHEVVCYGDILLSRSDANGDPANFTLQEYTDFTRLTIPEWGVDDIDDMDRKACGSDDDNDCIEEGSNEDGINDSDNEETLGKLKSHCFDSFVQQNGREPTEEEMESMLDNLMAKLGEGIGDDDDDDDGNWEDVDDEDEDSDDDDDDKDDNDTSGEYKKDAK